MLQRESLIQVGDNSGIKQIRFIRVLRVKGDNENMNKPGARSYAKLNDVIVGSIKKFKGGDYKKGQLVQALIVNTVYPYQEVKNVVTTRFDRNLAVIVKVNRATKKSRLHLEAMFSKVAAPILLQSVRYFRERDRSLFKLVL